MHMGPGKARIRSDRDQAAVEYVLKTCAGLPLALAVLGSSIRRIMDDPRTVKKIKGDHQGGDHNLESAWRTFRDILTQNLDRIGDMGTSGHNEGVFVSTQST